MESADEKAQATSAGENGSLQAEPDSNLVPNIGIGEVNWTVFVDNLRKRVSRGALWEVFSHYGEVIRVFISMANKKPRYKVTTFASVRFANENNMNRAIDIMNNSKIDGRVISVTKVKFPVPWSSGGEKKLLKDHRKVRDQVSITLGVVPKPTDGASKLADLEGLDSRTFRDVLIGKPKSRIMQRLKNDIKTTATDENSQSRLFDIHIPAKDIAWIDLSLVAVLKQLYDMEFIQNALLSDGINAKVAKWGNSDLFCVLTFNSIKDKEEAWNGRVAGLDFWFDHIELLLNNKGILAAFLNVSLVGVPLHCWHESFFVALGNRWSSFVSIDHNEWPGVINTKGDNSGNSETQSLVSSPGKEVSPEGKKFSSRNNPSRVDSVPVDNYSHIISPHFS
ncbi:hypothetical protein V6N13_077067 [Hibiscus sabdariffa]|uniref:RRM domain-containing protein n=1 Tax=Hibiscus sabdariffa TaxID=183260 RepID=A0ABR2CMQ7_9ROSI